MLYSAQMGSAFGSFLAGVILTQTMERHEFGRFAFCLSVFVITGLFFEFGVFSAGARLLATASNHDEERRVLGGLVVLAAANGLAFAAFVALAAAPIDLIFNQDVRWTLIGAAGLGLLHPFQLLIELSCQGLNRIRLLSLFQLMNSGGYVLILLGLKATIGLTAGLGLAAYLAAIGIASASVMSSLKPSFSGVRAYISAALKETREYGLDIYFARVSATVALRLDHPVIAFFLGRASSDLTPVALYNVPQRLGNPIATMSRALAVTRFRAFTRIGRVSKRISRWNLAILVAASAGLVVVGPWVIKLFFPRYVETIPLLLPFAVLNLFAGLFQPYNMFLTSRGYAREVRNIAIAVAVGNLTGLIIGVRFFGIIGAAWAGAASMALDYALHLYYYRKLTRVEVTPHELAAGPAQKQ